MNYRYSSSSSGPYRRQHEVWAQLKPPVGVSVQLGGVRRQGEKAPVRTQFWGQAEHSRANLERNLHQKKTNNNNNKTP